MRFAGLPRSAGARRRALVASIVSAALLAACSSPTDTHSASPPPASFAVSPTPLATATAPPLPSPTVTITPAATSPAQTWVLDGLPATAGEGTRLPVAVMVDDARAARPQAGFNAASIVYHAPADGYETRYLMVFQSADTSRVGPIRSARLYYALWASEVNAAIAHYGGDRRTRYWLEVDANRTITDLDALKGRTGGAFRRDTSRRMPHNAYASTEKLRRLAIRRGAEPEMRPSIQRRAFIEDLPLAERPAAQTITIPYNTVKVGYAYDRASNQYLRSLDGRPHKDEGDGARVTARNVVVIFAPFRIDTKIEPGHSRPDMDLKGKGTAWVFREGTLQKAYWVKDTTTAVTRIVDGRGDEIPLLRGRTFFQAVPIGTRIRVRP